MASKGRKPGLNNMERYTFRIKNDLLEQLKEFCERENITVSDAIRCAIITLLSENDSLKK